MRDLGYDTKQKWRQYDIAVTIGIDEQDIGIFLSYWSTSLRDERASGITSTLRQIVQDIIDRPHSTARELDIVGGEDRRQIYTWNSTVPARVDRCVHDLIVERCRAQPDAPAVCAWDGDLTYGELDALSSALAMHLAERGVGPEVFVPLCFEKSRWTTVAMVGVMKAGGAFVLLDPSHPRARLETICRTVAAPLVVSSAANQVLAAGLAAAAVVVGDNEKACRSPTQAWTGSAVTPDNALYAVFTSGSTGTSKGIVIEHVSFCTGGLAHIKAKRMTSNLRVFQFTSYSFDTSISDNLTTLLTGACICVPSESDRKDNIVAAIQRLQCNFLDLTPSLAKVLDPGEVPTVQTLVLGGEEMRQRDLEVWSASVRLIHAYGPAECCIDSVVQRSMNGQSNIKDIGYATGCVCWVVDRADHERLVPIGAVGELLIEGPIVGRGYLNDPERTAAAFVAPPSWLRQFRGGSGSGSGSGSSGRLYKTGDLVQYAADGSLRFVGRKDTQVKLRGQRIELGEVEHHTRRSFPGARDVVAEVVTPAEAGRAPLLVAFVWVDNLDQEGRNGGEGEDENKKYDKADDKADDILAAPTDSFRAAIPAAETALHDAVPAYMVPAVFLPLRGVPLSATGKTDRRRLRDRAAALSRADIEAYHGSVATKRRPATPAERTLQQLWARVLNLPPADIGADDSFFRLGGDSIAAMKLAGVAREDGLGLTVALVFQQPKLSNLARAIQPASGVAVNIPSPFSLLDEDGLRDAVLQLAVDQCRVSRDQIADLYPCTALQEGLIALTAKTAGAYIAHFSYHLPYDTDLDRFRAAWNAVARANPILNTRIIQHDQWGSFQVVVPADLPWAVYDNEERSSAEAAPSFGLGEPMAHAAVVRGEGPKTAPRFILSMHHAVYDAWSVSLLLEQAAAAFQGDSLVARPFSPFVAYLGESKAAAEAFWRSQFTGLDATCFPSLPTPAYTPHPTESITYTMALPQGPMDDFTPATKLRLAWALTLAQYTDAQDVVFGLTVTGRAAPVAGIEQMTGPTIATIPLRVRLDSDTTVVQALQRVQDQSTTMLAYEQTGLQKIRRLSDEAAAACQFQNLLVVQPQRDGGAAGLFTEADVSAGQGAFTTYALTLLCDLASDAVTVQATYDPQTIGAMEVQRMLYQLGHLTQQISVQSETSIKDVGGVSPEDRRQIQEWNKTVPARVDRCVHALVEERCRAQPDAPAVCAWDGDFTYGELDVLSSALAAHLAERGVGPEVFVPLCFEKSRWTTVAMVGVMKAGGAFVLLDPSHPRARLRGICQTVSARLVVSSAANRTLAAELAAAVVVVSDDETAWRSPTQAWPGSAVTPDNALYAVFTSGSTGAPKGTVIPHAAFATGALAHAPALGIERDSRVFQFSSYAFDNSVSDILTTLSAGACVCVPSEMARRSHMTEAIKDLRVTLCFLTPSVARLCKPAELVTVLTIILMGEAPTANDFSKWPGHVCLFNEYGPAECTVIAAVRQMTAATTDPRNIGSATGCVCWVVDRTDHERLMPIGTVGELLIEGPIVGRGYLNDPERTAAAFVAPPSWLRQFRGGSGSSNSSNSNSGGGRLYKTGDLVQYAADGSLRFVGRKDTQVKLRGQRIELGEVEHHTRRSFPGARDVVAEVVTPVEAGRAPMLVAFVWVDNPNQEGRNGGEGEDENKKYDKADDILAAPTDSFRAAIPAAETALHDAVPAYMVPAVFLPLRGVPLSATGKTDRRRLRDRAAALSRADIEAYHGSVATKRRPATPAERTLQQLWARVLNLPPADIGADDSFFRLGGDSIAAMKLAGVAREDGLGLTVALVFQQPKLSNLARAIQPASGVAVNIPSPFSLLDEDGLRDAVLQLAVDQCRVSRDQIADLYPCTALQEGLIALTAKTAGAYIAHFSYHLPYDTDLDRFRAAWNAVARANPILNTRIIQHDQWGSFQVVVPADLPWAVYDNEERSSAEAAPSFGLGEPMAHAAVVRGEGPKTAPRFILSMHHAVYDAWSVSLLLEQAAAAFQGDSLVARPFSPFVAYLGESKAAAEAFWRSQFTGLDATCFPSLPTPAYTPHPTESITYTMALPQGPMDDFTPATKLRLAWALTLAQYTDAQDVVLGLTVTGRAAPVAGIEQMTGPTIATVPLRVRLDPDATVAQALQRVQDQSTAMLAYEQTGLQKIRRLSDEAAAACQFQNLLVIQPRRDGGAAELFTEAGVSAGQGAFTTYALTLLCDLANEAVTVQVTYDPQTIGAVEVQRMLYQLGHITQQISEQPGALIKDVGGVSPEDQRQLQEWNQTVPTRVDRCVHALVEERCRAQPDAPAVCAWDGDFTYGELDVLSSALAAHLAARGVGPEVFVPLCFEKSRWTTVAMVGVMKAGGAFVLLDPSHPRARLRGICQTVSARLVVSSAANRTLAAELAAAVVVVSDDETAWRSPTQAWPGSAVTPDNALYAVFTSGSTGAPKGTVIPHAAFATSAFAHSQNYHLTSQSRVLQFTSYVFDVSIVETITILHVGGCICVPSDAARRNNIAVAATELRVSLAQLTPSTARLLRPGDITTLETLVLIGEPVTSSDIDQWGGQVQLVNGYGPAECSAISSVHPTLHAASEAGNIGWAAGCVCWVVDSADHKRLVPIGAVGELLIEGPIVGRGYLNDPERTAAAFVAPPAWLRQFRGSSDGSGGRLYKTGDLVQYAADGSLRFVGRKDTQVKLRGQRIELGEVEHHTRRSFPGARDVVAEVVTPVEAGRAPMLVAFVWVHNPNQGDRNGDDRNDADEQDASNEHGQADDILAAPTDSFRAAIPAAEATLLDVVPAYMVPTVFLPLRGVPLSATGKTDRRRLRERAAALARADLETYHSSRTAKRRPATPAERTLQALWAQVLNLSPSEIGADDNFFRLGGDSIAAMKLAGVAREDGLTLIVAQVFQYPILCQHALTISSVPLDLPLPAEPAPFSLLDLPNSDAFLREVDISHHSWHNQDIVDAFPTTEFQAGVVTSHQCTYFHLNIPGPIDSDSLQAACQSLVERHPILRTVFFPSSKGVVQAIVRCALPAMARYTSDTDLHQFSTTVCRDDSRTPLPFGAMSFQASLVSGGPCKHILILRLSHAQYDGLSLPVLYHDLAAAYRGDMTAPTLSFSTYMQYRLSRKSADVFRFWRDFLRGANMTRLDYSALGGVDRASSTDITIKVDKNIPLPNLPSGITMATVVKAAWSFVLAQLAHQTDIVFGQLVNGRSGPIPNIERIVGPCVNYVPVRITFQSAWTVLDLLEYTQNQHTQLLPYETSDLRDIVKQSTTWADSTHFEIVVQHDSFAMDTPFSLGGIECNSSAVAFHVRNQLCVYSQQVGNNLQLSISAPSKMVNSLFAARILDDVCETILSFTHDTDQLLSLRV